MKPAGSSYPVVVEAETKPGLPDLVELWRYRGLIRLLAARDVKLQDADLQAFLQTDTFNRLVNDKAARRILARKDVQRALADPKVQEVYLGTAAAGVEGVVDAGTA